MGRKAQFNAVPADGSCRQPHSPLRFKRYSFLVPKLVEDDGRGGHGPVAAQGQLCSGTVPGNPEAVAALQPAAAGEGHHKRRGRLSELGGNLLLMDEWTGKLIGSLTCSSCTTTEPRKKVGTWLRDISSWPCLASLPGPAWLWLSNICKPFFSLSPVYFASIDINQFGTTYF